MNNLAFRPSFEDESPLQQAPSELSRLDRLIVPAIVAGRPVAKMPQINDMHPIAIAMPLIAPTAMIAAFWLALAASDRSLISAVAVLIVMMVLGPTAACVALAHKVGPNGTRTRSFREFLNGEVDVETGRISGRVAFRQVATVPVAVAIGSTLILACAMSSHG